MNMPIMLALVVAAIVVWWLLLRQLQVKPWLEQGVLHEPLYSATFYPSKVIGLGVFLAVVTALFALFATAYHMRMQVPDWTHLPLPRLLWLNTALLALGSIALQAAWFAADRYTNINAVALLRIRIMLLGAGIFTIAFLVGQLAAWRQLDANGFFFACSPASAFFYVLTGLHGLHLAGGLCVWGSTTLKLCRSDVERHAAALDAAVLNVKLCAIYWHYLLLIWLALFALFALT